VWGRSRKPKELNILELRGVQPQDIGVQLVDPLARENYKQQLGLKDLLTRPGGATGGVRGAGR
jgi:hypothetical protein